VISVTLAVFLAFAAPMIVWWALTLPLVSWYSFDPIRGCAQGFAYRFTVDAFEKNRDTHVEAYRCTLELGWPLTCYEIGYAWVEPPIPGAFRIRPRYAVGSGLWHGVDSIRVVKHQAIVTVVIGFVVCELFIRAIAIFTIRLRESRRRSQSAFACFACGYSRLGLGVLTCPECGRRLDATSDRRAARRDDGAES
jgi:hypothetical protein